MNKIFFALVALFLTFSSAAWPADPLEKYRDGVSAFEKKKFGDAQKLFNEFITEHPYEAEVRKAWYYLSLTAAAQGNCHEAITRANITLDRYPAHIDRIELRVLTGECLYRVDAHARAEKILNETGKQTKDNVLKYRIEKTLGFIKHDARLHAQAALHLKNALQLRAKSAPADADLLRIYSYLGKIYADDALQVEAAAGYLAQAIAVAETLKSPELRSLRILLQKISLRRIDKINGLPDNSIADIRVDEPQVDLARQQRLRLLVGVVAHQPFQHLARHQRDIGRGVEGRAQHRRHPPDEDPGRGLCEARQASCDQNG